MKDCKKEKTKTIYSNPLPMEKIIGDEEAWFPSKKKFFMPICV